MNNGETLKVKAKKVREGDFIPGLANGYVFEKERSERFTYPAGALHSYSNVSMGDTVLIVYHDAEGEENYLLLKPDTELTIVRGAWI